MLKNSLYHNFLVVGLTLLFIAICFSSIAKTNTEKFHKEGIIIIKNNTTPKFIALPNTNIDVPINNVISFNSSQVTENGSHPALARDFTGCLFAAYDNPIVDGIIWTYSIDNGQSWDPGVYYSFNGLETIPSIDYWGSDTRFFGTMVPSHEFYNGGIVPLFECTDPTDNNTYSWDFCDLGDLYDIIDAEIACDDSQEQWEFGFISLVSSSSDVHNPMINGPFIVAKNPDVSDWFWISWYFAYNGCAHTTADIDKITHKTYATYDWYDPDLLQWILLIRKNDFSYWPWVGGPSEMYEIIGDGNFTSPVVAANNNNVIILAETNENGNQDIVCLYSDNGVAGGNLEISYVGVSEDNEVFPEISYFYEDTFICTFIRNGDLFKSITEDGGITWCEPILIDDIDNNVTEEYKSTDLCEFGLKTIFKKDEGIYIADIVTPEPDIECNGELDWINVVAGSIVEGYFYVENIGEPSSSLNWEISDYPDWGVWTFDPQNGTSLTPEEDSLRVEVTVVAPPPTIENIQEFTGEIKIINTDNSSDFCILEVNLAFEKEPPTLNIIKPDKSFYILNEKKFPFFFPVIFGPIDIEVIASDNLSGIAKVDFYINNELRETDTLQPYEWLWDETVFFKQNIKVIAVDKSGNMANNELLVWKFF